ncbi:MAG TPA: dihydrofolate reductase family protein [Saprospiraceae bacterium]|nr:dihydrofolate reductase family protein [Saprospiraceae bacterium]
MTERKVILYIAVSLDGFIAGPNDELDFLKAVEREGEDYGYADFTHTVDTVIMGRKTYEKVLSMGYPYPHLDKESYILTRTPRPSIGHLHFYTGQPVKLVEDLKKKPGKNIFVDGGARVVNELLAQRLFDEFYISIIPILLGKGIRLFDDQNPETLLDLVKTTSFDSGLVQLHYLAASS